MRYALVEHAGTTYRGAVATLLWVSPLDALAQEVLLVHLIKTAQKVLMGNNPGNARMVHV